MPKIAGSLELTEVMGRLAADRPVFHNERDFQLALGLLVREMDSTVRVRMEVRLGDEAEYLDMLCWGPAGRTALELKYFKAAWSGVDTPTGERYRLSAGGADDEARRDFVFDVARLERFCGSSAEPMEGIAIELTNHSALWRPPRGRKSPQRDIQFRVHHGTRLTGELRWGGETEYLPNRTTLDGDYLLEWQPYSHLGGANGEFRWLAVAVESHPQKLPA